jgi:hypothetical protein
MVAEGQGENWTDRRRNAHTALTDVARSDSNDREIDDVLRAREEGREDPSATLDHQVVDGGVESVEEREEVKDACRRSFVRTMGILKDEIAIIEGTGTHPFHAC